METMPIAPEEIEEAEKPKSKTTRNIYESKKIVFCVILILVVFGSVRYFPHIYSYTSSGLNAKAESVIEELDSYVSGANHSGMEMLQEAIVVGHKKVSIDSATDRLPGWMRSQFLAKLLLSMWSQHEYKPNRALQETYDIIHEFYRLDKQGYTNLSNVDVSSIGTIAAVAIRNNSDKGIGGAPGQLLLWPSMTSMGKAIDTRQGVVSAIAFSRNGKYIASASTENKEVKIFDADSLEFVKRFPLDRDIAGRNIDHIEFSDSGDYLTITCKDGYVIARRFQGTVPESQDWIQNNNKYRACLISINKGAQTSRLDEGERRPLQLWSLFQDDDGILTPELENELSPVRYASYNPNIVRNVAADGNRFRHGLVDFVYPNTSAPEQVSTDIYIGSQHTDAESGQKVGGIESMSIEFQNDSGCRWTSLEPKPIEKLNAPVISLELKGDSEVYALSSDDISLVNSPLFSADNAGTYSKDYLERATSTTTLYSRDDQGFLDTSLSVVFSDSGAIQTGRLVVSDESDQLRFFDFSDREIRLRNENEVSQDDPEGTVNFFDLHVDLSKETSRSFYKLALLTANGTIRIYNNQLQSMIGELSPGLFGLSPITAAIWDRENNNRLITGHANGDIISWPFNEESFLPGEFRRETSLSEGFRDSSITALAFGSTDSEDDTNTNDVIAVSSDNLVKLYLKGTADSRGQINSNISIDNIGISPTADYVATIGKTQDDKRGKRFEVLDIRNQQGYKRIKLNRNDIAVEEVRDIAWYPKKKDDFDVLVALMKEDLCFWQLTGAEIERSYLCVPLPTVQRYSNSWDNIEFKQDGTYMILVSNREDDRDEDGGIFVFDIHTMIQSKKLKDKETEMFNRIIAIFGREDNYSDFVKFSSDNNIIVASKNGYLEKLNIGNMNEYMRWSCQQIHDYVQTHPNEEFSKNCQHERYQ